MTIMTIESMTYAKDLEMRRMLVLKPRFVVFPNQDRYISASSVISSIALFAETIRSTKESGVIFVFPFSMIKLKTTEIYRLAMKLINALGVHTQKHILVCIDGDENSALEELFDLENCNTTLDDLRHMRRIITGTLSDNRLFISNDYTIVRIVTPGTNDNHIVDI